MFPSEVEGWLGKDMYEGIVQTEGAVSKATGFTYPTSQQSQFKSLYHQLRRCNWGVEKPITLMDFGGGVGDLIPFLLKRGVRLSGYGIVDPVGEFADAACSTAEAESIPVLYAGYPRSWDELPVFDVFVALSVFSWWTGPADRHKETVLSSWKQMHRHARLGCSLTLTSPWADWFDHYQRPVSPDWFVQQTKDMGVERVNIDLLEAPHLFTAHTALGVSDFRREWGKKSW